MINIQIYPTIQEVVVETANQFFSLATEEIQQKDIFNVALSGGNTPQPLYEFLGEDPSGNLLEWHKIHFFWSDERPVPPDHPDSNFRQAYLSLLLPRQIPPDHIHRIKGELEPEAAALDAQQELAGYFQSDPPRFDLILLGMGSDGHTASLFPGTKAVLDPQPNQWAAANYLPQSSSWRITFTPVMINNAAQVLFLVTGKSKAETLVNVLEGPYLPDIYPSQLIKLTNGTLRWMVDQPAGHLLSSI